MRSNLLVVASFCLGSLAAQVPLGNTTLIGTNTRTMVEFFGGIPYAEPPIGNLRLRRPVFKPTLNTPTFDATKFGPGCLQLTANIASSEDCLKVNIYRPTESVRLGRQLPVMVFIHGSGFLIGSSSQFDGSPLVLKSIDRGTPVVFASLNYRLGPLGFPAGAEADRNGALNLGLRDQLAALEWIKRNIAAFGGDPAKVTVFGVSAGAMSIGIFSLNPAFRNYVRGAIFESATSFTFDAARRQSLWNVFVDAIPGCSSSTANTFDCLRTANSSSLLQAIDVSLAHANEVFPWVPVLDGPNGLMPELPSQLFAKGRFAKIPFISGANLDEATLFTPTTTSSSGEIRDTIISNFTTRSDGTGTTQLAAAVDHLLQLYPDNPALGSPFNTGNETFGLSSQYKRSAALRGDLMFHSVRRLWAQKAVQAGVKAYGYLFTGPGSALTSPELGVSHGLEMLYVFGFIPFLGGSQADIALGDQMMDYWISFATSLDPNDGKGTQRPIWPQYTTYSPTLLELNSNKIAPIPDDYRATGIDFMNRNAALFRH